MLFFPVNNRTWTCFHNLLNHPPIGDATVWCYCQLFTTTNNAALSRIIGSKSRNISNVKEILSSQKIAPVYTPTKCVVFPHHPTVCFHERLFLGLPTFSGQQLLSPLSRSSPHLSPLLLSLHTCSFSKQTPHDIIWPEESIVWRLLSLISSGKLTYLLVLSHIPGKKGAGTSLRQEWIQRLKLSLYLSYSWLCWSCLTTFSPPECSNRNYSCRQLQPSLFQFCNSRPGKRAFLWLPWKQFQTLAGPTGIFSVPWLITWVKGTGVWLAGPPEHHGIGDRRRPGKGVDCYKKAAGEITQCSKLDFRHYCDKLENGTPFSCPRTNFSVAECWLSVQKVC